MSFFKFLQKKVSWLDKKLPTQFCTILGFVICQNHVANPLDSFNKCRKFLLSSQETFICKNLKKYRMSFLSQCNVEAASHPGLQGLSCSKVARFEGGFITKTFQGLHFLFSGGLVGQYIFEQFAHETNLKKKRSVSMSEQLW